jgi:threonine/homoserine/homoserine lactone efflux protein
MNADTLLTFSALALITVATPGPTLLLAMTHCAPEKNLK